MTATYALNAEHNGIEITFAEKPYEIIRDEMKNLGFRWHNGKKMWYAKQTAERLELAERLANPADLSGEIAAPTAEPTAAPLEIPSTEFVDGGGLYDGWQGGNRNKWSDERELKTLLAADFKKAGISASIRFNRGGYTTSMTVTMKITADDIRTPDEWQDDFDGIAQGWNVWMDENGNRQEIFGERYYSLPIEEQERLYDEIQAGTYRLLIENLISGSHHRRCDLEILTAAALEKYDLLRAIVDSYNRDCSNSMIDYFDRSIYDSFRFKLV